MISNRPYLIRAFYQWIIDSNCTPILVIDATYPRCKVPQDFVEGGEIVFNISPNAIRDIKMTNEVIEFKASFSGVVHLIAAPTKAILAVYAEENGEGIFFDGEEEDTTDGTTIDRAVPLRGVDNMHLEAFEQEITAMTPPQVKGKARPILKLVE